MIRATPFGWCCDDMRRVCVCGISGIRATDRRNTTEKQFRPFRVPQVLFPLIQNHFCVSLLEPLCLFFYIPTYGCLFLAANLCHTFVRLLDLSIPPGPLTACPPPLTPLLVTLPPLLP